MTEPPKNQQTTFDKPSWMRWPPNCCEACTGWVPIKDYKYVGTCTNARSIHCGFVMDSRDRCVEFVRKPGI